MGMKQKPHAHEVDTPFRRDKKNHGQKAIMLCPWGNKCLRKNMNLKSNNSR